MAHDALKRQIAQRRKRLDRIRPFLICPECSGGLDFTDDMCVCAECEARHPIRDGRIYFVEEAGTEDSLDDLKEKARQFFGRYYRPIADVVAPDFPVFRKRETDAVFNTASDIVIDCGSGNHRLDDHIITLDFTGHDAVDIVCDICGTLPFADGCLDGATSWGVIEHLERPYDFVSELARCIKPDGEILHLAPFMYPFHASPRDFFRFSDQGLNILFSPFQTDDVRNVCGPISFFLLGLVEFGSVVFSLGRPRLKGVVYLFLCLLVFPVKIFDLPFIGRPAFNSMAPCLLVRGRRLGPRASEEPSAVQTST